MNENGKKVEDDELPPPEAGAAKEIVLVNTDTSRGGIALRNLDDLQRFARMCVKGNAAPKGMNDGQAAIAIQAGIERGLGALGGLQQAVVINGVLSWRGQAAAALIQNSGKCKTGTLKFWHEGSGDNLKGVATAHRVGYPQPDRLEFTPKDAKQAHLWGKAGPWQDHPGRMLMWRALGFLARDVFPDVLGGFPLAEEAEDFEPVKAERPAITAKAELMPPSAPDPLLEALAGKSEVIEEGGAWIVREVEPEKPKEEGEVMGIEVEPEAPTKDAPFESHEEADKELAKEPQLEFPG